MTSPQWSKLGATGKHDYTAHVKILLRALSVGPHLATQLPKLPSALVVAESRGLCRGRCVSQGVGAERSAWLWSITEAGRQWLATRVELETQGRTWPAPAPKGRMCGAERGTA